MKKIRIAVFGGSFNPPGLHHLNIGHNLAKEFDQVMIVPCGLRPDKQSTNNVTSAIRLEMVKLTFSDSSLFAIVTIDLERESEFMRAYELDQHFRQQYAEAEVWQAVGSDLVKGGSSGESQIQKSWSHGLEIWTTLNFAVITRPGHLLADGDLPPHSQLIELAEDGSSSEIRRRILSGQPIDESVVPRVAQLIRQQGLYM
jgi:nicotinate (nicotinamide) nucleotide adenylyltransferase